MNRDTKVITAITYLLLTLLILDVKYAPISLTLLVTDVITILLFSSIVLSLAFLSFKIVSRQDLLILLPAAIILVFLVRALPNIILYYPPLADPYYHFVCTSNIIDFGTIQSQVNWWYSQADVQLNWPLMQILTAQTTMISGMNILFFYRFLMPFIGVVFFLGITALTYDLTKQYGPSLLAGLIGSLSATTIFYQSEYHPQALALTLFVFVLIGFFRSRTSNTVSFSLISLIIISASTLSHHFSTLFLSLISLTMVGLIFIGQRIPYLRKWFSFLTSDISFLSLFVIVIFSFYVYTMPDQLRFLFDWSLGLSPITGNAEYIREPLITTILNSAKWIPISIVLLAIPSIIWTKKQEFIRPLIILFVIFTVGSFSLFLFFLPLDRLLAFSMPIIGVICSIALFKLYASTTKVKRSIFIGATIAISLAMIAGIFASQTPAYFFKTSGPDPYYWYNNQPPNAVETQISGLWSSSHIQTNATYGVTFASWDIAFYYGKNPSNNIYTINDQQDVSHYIVDNNAWFGNNTLLVDIKDKTNTIYSGPNISYYTKVYER